MTPSGTAKLFMDGDTQAVRLPSSYRLPGTEVRVSRVGRALLLEPVAPSAEQVTEILAELDRLAEEDGPFLPEGRQQPPMPAGGGFNFFDDDPS